MIQKEFTSNELFLLREIVEEEVENMFSDAVEIGSSDISACTRNCLNAAKVSDLEHTDSSFQLSVLRNMVRVAISVWSK